MSTHKRIIFYQITLASHWHSLQTPIQDNPTGKNSSLIFTAFVKSAPLYHFKLAHVVLHMAVKELFEAHFPKIGEIGRFILQGYFLSSFKIS